MDTISQMLTKIRNAQMAGHKETQVTFSKFKFALAKILEREGFLESVFKEGKDKETIRLVLRYIDKSKTKKIPAITGIEKVSRPGQRIYIRNDHIKKIKNNFGISIISTSKGVMTGKESREKKVGGEYVCNVW